MEKHLGHPVFILASPSGSSVLHRGALSSRRTAMGLVGPDGSQISWERTVLAQLEGQEPGGCGEKKESRNSGCGCCLCRPIVSHRGSST